jgi:hypothetical protein
MRMPAKAPAVAVPWTWREGRKHDIVRMCVRKKSNLDFRPSLSVPAGGTSSSNLWVKLGAHPESVLGHQRAARRLVNE